MYKLYLDDVEFTWQDWVLIKSFDDFVTYITEHGIPKEISFGTNLVGNKRILDCADWFCDYFFSKEFIAKDNYEFIKWDVHNWKNDERKEIEALLFKFQNYLNGLGDD